MDYNSEFNSFNGVHTTGGKRAFNLMLLIGALIGTIIGFILGEV